MIGQIRGIGSRLAGETIAGTSNARAYTTVGHRANPYADDKPGRPSVSDPAWQAYLEGGTARAQALGNRGPVRTRAEISREGDEYWQRDITL